MTSITLEEFEAELAKMKSSFFGRSRLRYRRIRRRISDIPYNLKKIKWFYQRGKRGWADCDWWCMDMYLTSIILPMLKQLRENSIGYPGYSSCKTPEQWDNKLDTMISAFEAADRVANPLEYDNENCLTEIRNDMSIFKAKGRVFLNYFFNLWD